MFTNYFSRIFQVQRKALGLSQNDISNILKISPQAVSKWEKGSSLPDITILGEIANILQVPLSSFIDGIIPDTFTINNEVFSMEIFIEYLSSLRRLNRFTQKDLANKLGVSYQTISKWEKGETLPSLDNLYKLCEIYSLTIDDIYYARNNKLLEIKKDNLPKSNIQSNEKIIKNNKQLLLTTAIVLSSLLLISCVLIVSFFYNKKDNSSALYKITFTDSDYYLSIKLNTSVGVLPKPVKEGYDFLGWYYKDSIIGDNSIWVYKSNAKLIPKYEIKKYQVTFKYDDHELINTFDYGTIIDNIPSIPSKDGYNSLWSYDFTKPIISDTIITINDSLITYNEPEYQINISKLSSTKVTLSISSKKTNIRINNSILNIYECDTYGNILKPIIYTNNQSELLKESCNLNINLDNLNDNTNYIVIINTDYYNNITKLENTKQQCKFKTLSSSDVDSSYINVFLDKSSTNYLKWKYEINKATFNSMTIYHDNNVIFNTVNPTDLNLFNLDENTLYTYSCSYTNLTDHLEYTNNGVFCTLRNININEVHIPIITTNKHEIQIDITFNDLYSTDIIDIVINNVIYPLNTSLIIPIDSINQITINGIYYYLFGIKCYHEFNQDNTFSITRITDPVFTNILINIDNYIDDINIMDLFFEETTYSLKNITSSSLVPTKINNNHYQIEFKANNSSYDYLKITPIWDVDGIDTLGDVITSSERIPILKNDVIKLNTVTDFIEASNNTIQKEYLLLNDLDLNNYEISFNSMINFFGMGHELKNINLNNSSLFISGNVYDLTISNCTQTITNNNSKSLAMLTNSAISVIDCTILSSQTTIKESQDSWASITHNANYVINCYSECNLNYTNYNSESYISGIVYQCSNQVINNIYNGNFNCQGLRVNASGIIYVDSADEESLIQNNINSGTFNIVSNNIPFFGGILCISELPTNIENNLFLGLVEYTIVNMSYEFYYSLDSDLTTINESTYSQNGLVSYVVQKHSDLFDRISYIEVTNKEFINKHNNFDFGNITINSNQITKINNTNNITKEHINSLFLKDILHFQEELISLWYINHLN